MGIAHTATVLRLKNLPPSSKLLLLVMSIAADAQGRGELTPKELADQTGLSGRTVRDHLPQLFNLRLIEKRRYDNQYTLTLPEIWDR